ncbi:hypothetical protein KFE25_000035 [Diacronema lutheri]|uniref:Uncharacterized protein n=2 Tax=Diacronema lutheri TaxID=2081491 RepID=A0A8J6C6T6_DIALT|nr:hypothetical protein KFE25_000035 [Diacronema lutheri]
MSTVSFPSLQGVMDEEAQVRRACQEMSKSFNALITAHKQHRASTGDARTSSHAKQASLIESFLSGIVQQLVQYEGTRALVRSASSSDSGADTARTQDVARRFSFPMHRVGIFERGVAWEKERNARLAEVRLKKHEAETAPPPARRPSQWDHVQSVMRRQRLEEEELKRKADKEAERLQAEEARARAQLVARAAAEAKLTEEAQREDAAIEAAIKRQQAEAARRKAEADRLAREARAAAAREAERKKAEVHAAFGTKGLERRGSMPNKMVWRVNSPSGLTGNVAHEYRVKDKLTGTRGVSFVMGQSVEQQEEIVQCVLFDQDVFDEHKAALWWQENEHRFAAQQRKNAAAAAAAAAMHQGKPAAAALAAAGRALSSASLAALPAVNRADKQLGGAQNIPPSAPISEMPGGLKRTPSAMLKSS